MKCNGSMEIITINLLILINYRYTLFHIHNIFIFCLITKLKSMDEHKIRLKTA